MTFKTWLEGLEEYEPFKARIEKSAAGRRFAFDSWWPAGQDRIYIPLDAEGPDSKTKKEIIDILNKFKGIPHKGMPAASHYNLVSYKDGLVQPEGGKNLYKVMRVFNAIKSEDLDEIKRDFESGKISKNNAEIKIKRTEEYYKELEKEFSSDPTRSAKKSALEIVLSKDIHDLGSMSTGRGWTSCMHLGSGAHKEDVYCEVKDGGFVAYLIRNDDKEIKNPLARLHIRRFDTKNHRNSIAVPEQDVYGTADPKFAQMVQSWIDSKQGMFKPGVYKRRGGDYSDTFSPGREHALVPATADAAWYTEQIKKWLKISSDKRTNSDNKKFINEIIKNLVRNSQPEKIDSEIMRKVGEILFPDVYGDAEFTHTWAFPITNFTVCKFMNYFPQSVTKHEIDRLIDEAKNNKMTPRTSSFATECAPVILKKFSKFVSPEQLKTLTVAWSDLNSRDIPEEVKKMKAQIVVDNLDQEISLDNIMNFDVISKGLDSPFEFKDLAELRSFISNQLDLASMVKPMNAKTINTIVSFYNETLPAMIHKIKDRVAKLKAKNAEMPQSAKKDEDARRLREAEQDLSFLEKAVTDSVIESLTSGKADTPPVIKLFQSLMPNFLKLGGLAGRNGIGEKIASLGINATPFLPFFKKLKDVYEEMLQSVPDNKENEMTRKELDGNIEKTNFVIDSIENDRISKKYSSEPLNFSFRHENKAVPIALSYAGFN